eukprot:3747854-Rhodomonas_salina.1
MLNLNRGISRGGFRRSFGASSSSSSGTSCGATREEEPFQRSSRISSVCRYMSRFEAHGRTQDSAGAGTGD